MTMDKYKYIEKLLESFFNGETTNEEEKELYTFFSQKDIPDEFQRYKPVFQYLGSDIKEEFTEPESIIVNDIKPSNKRWVISLVAGIAASIIVAFSLPFFFNKENNSFDSYEGSYIIENGVRITNLDEIRPQLEEVEREAFQQRQDAENEMQQIVNLQEYYSEEELKIEKEHYSFLEQIEDTGIREEIRNSLQ